MATGIDTNEQLHSLIKDEFGLAVYFSSAACPVCDVLKPKIEQMLLKEFPLIKFIEISANSKPQIAGQNGIFTAPTLIVFLKGHELLRSSGYMGISQLKSRIERPYFLATN